MARRSPAKAAESSIKYHASRLRQAPFGLSVRLSSRRSLRVEDSRVVSSIKSICPESYARVPVINSSKKSQEESRADLTPIFASIEYPKPVVAKRTSRHRGWSAAEIYPPLEDLAESGVSSTQNRVSSISITLIDTNYLFGYH